MILKIDPVENLGVNRLSNILSTSPMKIASPFPLCGAGKAPFAYEGKNKMNL
jgi:hypothetical protein